MIQKFSFVVGWEGLTYDEQQKIIQGVLKDLRADKEVQDYLLEIVGSDPFDVGRVNADDVDEYLENTVYAACERSHVEWSVSIGL